MNNSDQVLKTNNLQTKIYYNRNCISNYKFSKICRICLCEGSVTSIYSNIYENKTAYDILMVHALLEINLDDSLPQSICSKCAAILFEIYSFIFKCRRSDSLLRSVSNIKCISDSENKTTEAEHYSDFGAFKCLNYEETFNTNNLLSLHRKEVKYPEVRNHKCTVCSKTFASSKLGQHMRTHTKEKPFKCKICPQKFSMSSNLKRHLMIHTGERPHVCDVCKRGFIQATSLRNHKRTHIKHELIGGDDNCRPPFLCTDCGRGFKRFACYQIHLRHSGNINHKRYKKFGKKGGRTRM